MARHNKRKAHLQRVTNLGKRHKTNEDEKTMVKLNSGHEMPLVGFGYVPIIDSQQELNADILILIRLWKVNNDTCADQVYNAIKSGYRLFDGACGP